MEHGKNFQLLRDLARANMCCTLAPEQRPTSVCLQRELEPEQPSPVSSHISTAYINADESTPNLNKNAVLQTNQVQ